MGGACRQHHTWHHLGLDGLNGPRRWLASPPVSPPRSSYAFPKAHWRRIRSTNGLECLHGEIKRRIRVVGAFPDRASALRLITAVALHVTSIWGDRRYLDLSKEITRKAA